MSWIFALLSEGVMRSWVCWDYRIHKSQVPSGKTSKTLDLENLNISLQNSVVGLCCNFRYF